MIRSWAEEHNVPFAADQMLPTIYQESLPRDSPGIHQISQSAGMEPRSSGVRLCTA